MALHLHVSNDVIDNKTVRKSTLSQTNSSAKPIEIFYEFDQIIPWSEETNIDGHVFAILLYAMSKGMPLHVHGTVSLSALRNINELQSVWALWKPDIYSKIGIIANAISTTPNTKDEHDKKAISAFSGGVDAIYTALQHTLEQPEHLRYPLQSALMVHGFDVDIYNHDDFNALTKRVAPLLDELKIKLQTIRTNSRDLKIQDWSDSFALELAGCLHMLSGEFDYGLIGSSEPYDALVIPWGSTPMTDNLMSGAQFTVVHDGAGCSRTDKIAVVSKHDTSCKVLKVCWAGKDQSQNCGKCEKCVRTRMNFLATGRTDNLECFPDNFDLGVIDTINIDNKAQCAEMQSIIDYAHKNNVEGEWLEVLKKRLETWQPTDLKTLHRIKHGSKGKNAIKKIVVSLGLEDQAKKVWRTYKRKRGG